MITIWVNVKDELPDPHTFVIAMNYDHGWEDKALFHNGKFILKDGPLAGSELPFVQAWRYCDPDKQSNMERNFSNN